MRNKVYIDEPHIILFLNEIEKHGRCIIKLDEYLFEARAERSRYVISGIEKDGKRKDILIVDLIELFQLPFDVLEIDVLEKLFTRI